MVKVIHSSALPGDLSLEASVFEDSKLFAKKASDCACSVPAGVLDVPKGHVGIHLVALGDVERYGFNRNGDGFPKEANVKYHDTFVKHGHLHRNHKNKPTDEKLGIVKWSAYNDKMARVELFVHADESKCERELAGMRKKGEAAFSMACRVPNDRCCVCDTLRKTASDKNQCDHVRNGLGKLAEDGTYNGVYNDKPNFFDISFVHRPADRIAWSIKYAADGMPSSLEMADDAGLWLPADCSGMGRAYEEKMAAASSIAEFESAYAGMRGRGPGCTGERALWALAKSAAASGVSDHAIEALRESDPESALMTLASGGIVLSPVEFCKLAFGKDMGPLAGMSGQIKSACAGLIGRMERSGELHAACACAKYDNAFADRAASSVARMEKSAASQECGAACARALAAEIDGVEPSFIAEKEFGGVVGAVAREYSMYKLAAARVIFGSPDGGWRAMAALAARDMVEV
jgi:hypothetical protein